MTIPPVSSRRAAIDLQPVREAVSYRGLFTAGWFGVREKHCSRLKIYDRLRANEQAARSCAGPSLAWQVEQCYASCLAFCANSFCYHFFFGQANLVVLGCQGG